LTKAAETIIAEDTIASLRQRIAKLEAEKNTVQHTVENGNEDYDLLLEGNKSLLAERNNFHYRCEDLRAELMEVRSSTEKQITDLEAEVKSAEAHSTDVAGAGEKHLKDFEDELVHDLAELRTLYVRNAQAIGGSCSPMPKGEPSVVDYLRWLSTEIFGLPDMFDGVNENFATITIEGALTMAGDSVDLEVMQDGTVCSGADVLPAG
jgi:hypothetical protein